MIWRGMSDRLIFPSNQQKIFILKAKEKLNMNWKELGEFIDAHPRSLRDWARENHTMSYAGHLHFAVL